ncbi:MAG: TlpA disulfide reductase family protein [Ignavibacteriales bacterium]|nr:TlpA disulfide reductase family protein [Ignavibacteriales bacterium]
MYYSFIKLNKQYKIKTELLQLILTRYPKEDNYYKTTQDRLTQIQNEYIEFINVTAQASPSSFIAKYIKSAQLPVIDNIVQPPLSYLKSHALDNVDFNNSSLINSDVFTNKTIEYLTYFRNPQLPLELLEKEFMSAVDLILNKAKVNQLVYQHVVEYLIDGFKKFGFDKVLDYIVENYVIKDDLCLDVKTEGLIKRRIDQAKFLKIGNVVPNIIISDLSGKQIELNKMKAEKTLIVFYASWCPHCKELLPKLNEFYKTLIENKIEVLAISLDSKKDDWQNFITANCPSLINVSDLKGWDGKASADYFIYATPTMFLVDKDKKIISKPMTVEEVKALLKF